MITAHKAYELAEQYSLDSGKAGGELCRKLNAGLISSSAAGAAGADSAVSAVSEAISGCAMRGERELTFRSPPEHIGALTRILTSAGYNVRGSYDSGYPYSESFCVTVQWG